MGDNGISMFRLLTVPWVVEKFENNSSCYFLMNTEQFRSANNMSPERAYQIKEKVINEKSK
jgi:hypothetical protein